MEIYPELRIDFFNVQEKKQDLNPPAHALYFAGHIVSTAYYSFGFLYSR